jgi:membrane associated rhomboid family serine protease
MDPTIIILPALFGLIGFLLWMAITAWERRRRLQLMNDFHNRFFDRIGSLKDFSDFVQTPQGEALMKALTAGAAMDVSRERVVRALQIGLVLLSLSAGLFAVTRAVSFNAPEPRQLLQALSILSLALAVGSLASGLLAHVGCCCRAPDRNWQHS